MAYSDEYAAAINPSFQQRVQQSMIQAALNISTEATTSANHGNRVVLSKNVLNNPQNYVQQFAYAVAANLAITSLSSVSDANIDTSVASIWNGFAGVP